MPTLRRRLVCHYCNQRSQKQLFNEEGRKFKCEHCLAINFLDENGQIADVPPEETAPPSQQYAQQLSPGTDLGSSIFCSTCLKNQRIYNEQLGEYLPDPDDPDYASRYAEYEVEIPKYKKSLEERYPQCCARCEPAVRAQLQKATYVAKADHMRRMLQKSRQRRIASKLGWRSLVVRVTGFTYCLSIAVQLSWHLAVALAIEPRRHVPGDLLPPLQQCLDDRQVSTSCAEVCDRVVGPALVFGVLSAWWNPKWQHKLAGSEGRLTGLGEYYAVQAGLLVLRFSAWVLLHSNAESRLLPVHKPVHCLSFVLELGLVLWSSFSIIQVEKTPTINWQSELLPLLSNKQFIPPIRSETMPGSPPESQNGPFNTSQFSINNLGRANTSQREVWQPPTPPDDDADLMDLDYTPGTFQPYSRPVFTRLNHNNTPFRGILPAIPNNRMLHPKPEMQPQPKKAIGLPPGFFDRKGEFEAVSDQKDRIPVFADPKLFSENSRTDTGLENIFGAVFSLKEEPLATQDVQMHDLQPLVNNSRLSQPSSVRANDRGTWSPSKIFAVVATIYLLLSIAFLLTAAISSRRISEARLLVIGFSTGIPAIHIVLDLASTRASIRKDIALLIQMMMLGMLGLFDWRFDDLIGEDCGRIAIAVMAFMTYQEAILIFRDDRSQTIPAGVDLNAHLWRSPDIQGEPNSRQESDTQTNHYPAPPEQTYGWPVTTSQPSSRARTNSMDSSVSTASRATTSSTVSGWKTPKGTSARTFDHNQTPGWSSGLRGLTLNDSAGGTNIAGPREGPHGTRRR